VPTPKTKRCCFCCCKKKEVNDDYQAMSSERKWEFNKDDQIDDEFKLQSSDPPPMLKRKSTHIFKKFARKIHNQTIVKSFNKLFKTEFEEIIDKDNKKFIMIDKDIKVIEFAPDVFAYLRNMDGFNNASLVESLSPNNEGNVNNMFKAGEGMGRSGSFFFFSHDSRFLIKTMTTDDFNAFIKLLPLYFKHINYF